jgi:aryl-alcohol dehydrogenase-like predicted oxidoreductase
MEYTSFDRLEIPKIALGTWSWGTGMNGGDAVFGNHLGENDLKPVFEEAMKNGFTLWDTAAAYGLGASETILGQFIKGRGNIIISTKFTPIVLQTRSAMKKSLEKSLSRLGLNSIDIFWVHNAKNVEKWTNELIPLLKSGVVKHVGVSNHDLNQIIQADNILKKAGFHISAVQNHYSLLYRYSEKSGILDWCNKNKAAFFAYMLYEQGALTGKYSENNPFDAKSRRGKAYPVETLRKIKSLVDTLNEIGYDHKATPAQVILAWAISKNTIPLIGVTKVSHVKEAASALEINLSAGEIERIEGAAAGTGIELQNSWENRFK